jgi:hexosaminidase
MKKYLSILFFFLLITGCSRKEESFPSAKEISIKWELIANNYLGKGVFKSVISLTNNSSSKVLPNKGWELYFNFTPSRKIMMDSIPATIKFVHINGDLFKIIPTDKFPLLNPGESFSLPLLGSYLAIKYSDAPGGFYFIFEETPGKYSEPQIVENYLIVPFKNEQLKRDDNDRLILPTPLSRYNENDQLSFVSEKELPLIIPTPQKITYYDKSKDFYLTKYFIICYEPDLKSEAEYLQTAIEAVLGARLEIKDDLEYKSRNKIVLKKGNLPFSNSPEAYQLSISPAGLKITGNSNAGVFYGIQSLRALFPIQSYSQSFSEIPVKQCLIEDFPQFPYRGMLLDVVRHFHNKKSILKYLDLLSFYKINKFHFHLTDDEGWRIEIKKLSELTEVASKRGHTLTEQNMLIPSYADGPFGTELTNGFYSREDFIEILKYAKVIHIEIIPEIDLPGHARAAIKAMDVRYNRYLAKGDTIEAKRFLLRDLKDSSVYNSVQQYNDNVICPCQEGTYNFIREVSKELFSMYQEAGVPFQTMHLGGDEVAEGAWTKSPACDQFKEKNAEIETIHDLKSYFFKRTNDSINKLKVSAAVVEDMVFYRTNENGKSQLKISEELSRTRVKAYVWCNVWGWGMEDMGYQLANKGFQVVLCPVTNLYFDLAYTNEAEESGLYWGGFNDTRKAYEYTPLNIYNSAYNDMNGNPIDIGLYKDKARLSEKGKQNIIGLQGMLFSETLRSNDMLEYYTFPKLLGLAERAWSKQPAWAEVKEKELRLQMLNKEWNIFSNAIGTRELRRLDYMNGGINYWLPPPGVKVENGMMKANSCFPGLVIRYSSEGVELTQKSPVYTSPIKFKAKTKFATFSSKGRISRASIIY